MIMLRRFTASTSFVNSRIVLYSSKVWPSLNSHESTTSQSRSVGKDDVRLRNHLGVQSLLQFRQDKRQLDVRQIEVVDSDTWSISSGLARVSNGAQDASHLRLSGLEEVGDGVSYNHKQIESDSDIDDVEDMRIRGKLFYKVEQSSMEFEEYKFDFHGSKFKSKTNNKRESEKIEHLRGDSSRNAQTSLKSKEGPRQVINKENSKHRPLIDEERLAKTIKDKYDVCALDDRSSVGKKQRNPTFNQLTGPYHEPFCLDIYVSKGSVRACVVHRVTSKVVIVAHSISKDIKYDLGGSTKSIAAATAVGNILAKRALEDDIHDVIYTPRKGDKLEGKLQTVLQSIMDNGLNVKVKLKQRNPIKAIRKL